MKNILPPRTLDQVIKLRRFHKEFFGVCTFCGVAGHVGHLVNIDKEYSDLVEICDRCLKKHDRGKL